METELRSKVERISEMAYRDQEFYQRLTSAASADQLAAICRVEGVEVSGEEARAGFAFLQAYLAEGQSRVLNDAELERVAAGSQDSYKTKPIEETFFGPFCK